MFDQEVALLENRRINAAYYKISFRSKTLAKNVLPGQFLQIKIRAGWDPFLRRPFSYYRVQSDRIEILYEILGHGTGILAELKKGDRIQVLGPLGLPFSEEMKGRKRILVGGGVGVPPLVFLAERYGCFRFFIGTKTRGEVLPVKEMAKFQKEAVYSTEDGSYGRRGLVTELLERLFTKEKGDPEDYFIQTCGPNRMMRRVMEIANHYGIPGEASWDERMACGMGACLGCMVWTDRGWTPSCIEGPVFQFDEMRNV